LALPILDELTDSLGFSSPTSKTFTSTELNGQLARGVFRVNKLTMVAPDSRLYATGRVTAQGRLDIDVTADVPSVTTVAVVVGVLRPTDLLLRRLLFLHLGGTVRDPVVRPRVEEFVRQELQLFFLPILFIR
jgi:hypothetical protein